MPRLPAMEIDCEASDTAVTSFTAGVDQVKQSGGFGLSKKRCIEKFGHPIHFMRVGQVESDLDVVVRVFDDDEAVVVDVGACILSLEEHGAPFLHLGCAQARLLEEGDDIRISEGLYALPLG